MLDDGEDVYLTFSANSYVVESSRDTVPGRIDVSGDQITFSQSPVCDGVGKYTWAIGGATLSFETITEACPGRHRVLTDSLTYTKV